MAGRQKEMACLHLVDGVLEVVEGRLAVHHLCVGGWGGCVWVGRVGKGGAVRAMGRVSLHTRRKDASQRDETQHPTIARGRMHHRKLGARPWNPASLPAAIRRPDGRCGRAPLCSDRAATASMGAIYSDGRAASMGAAVLG